MKTAFLCLCMISFFIGNNLSYAQEVPPVETLHRGADDVRKWCEDLQNGNLDGIAKGLSPEMYLKYKKLLEENEDYRNYLKKHYEGATFEITDSKVIEGGVSFGVTVIMSKERGGRHSTTVCMEKVSPNIPGGDEKWEVASTKETFELRSVDEPKIVDKLKIVDE